MASNFKIHRRDVMGVQMLVLVLISAIAIEANNDQKVKRRSVNDYFMKFWHPNRYIPNDRIFEPGNLQTL